MPILRLSQQGLPLDWLSHEEAAVLISKDLVSWSLGDRVKTLRGGWNYSGVQSSVEIPAIIATKGRCRNERYTPALSNRLLFRRDNHQCMYCGGFFAVAALTRDHIVPKGQGGRDCWENVITACAFCNHSKACRTPEQAGMKLLAVPFRPNIFEHFYLQAHRIRGDQMDYLSNRFSSQRNWAA
ncbi:MAG: HNH endonuclease [Cellvibrionaceae bacterium]|nr:HNH endonuclease [Cellvibrionaceae bacterium]MCV6628174.1 HNH endonuclease [Cellvibrionaceae bacterium]